MLFPSARNHFCSALFLFLVFLFINIYICFICIARVVRDVRHFECCEYDDYCWFCYCDCSPCIRLQNSISLASIRWAMKYKWFFFSIHERVTSSPTIMWYMDGWTDEWMDGWMNEWWWWRCWECLYRGILKHCTVRLHTYTVHKLMSILKRDPWKSITFNYLEIKPSLKSVSTVILGNLSEKMSFSRVIESTISLPVYPKITHRP